MTPNFQNYQLNLAKDQLYIITGIANHRSIAAHTLAALAAQKVPLIITYQGEKLKSWALDLALSFQLTEDNIMELDVSQDSSLENFSKEIGINLHKSV